MTYVSLPNMILLSLIRRPKNLFNIPCNAIFALCKDVDKVEKHREWWRINSQKCYHGLLFVCAIKLCTWLLPTQMYWGFLVTMYFILISKSVKVCTCVLFSQRQGHPITPCTEYKCRLDLYKLIVTKLIFLDSRKTNRVTMHVILVDRIKKRKEVLREAIQKWCKEHV